MTWTPIAIDKVYDFILAMEKDLNSELLNFWELIKIDPEKWTEETYGNEGNGFWVVGLIGKNVIWYNDIEEGFNISNYKTYGTIDDYYCNQDELIWTLKRLLWKVKLGGDIIGNAGPPEKLK